MKVSNPPLTEQAGAGIIINYNMGRSYSISGLGLIRFLFRAVNKQKEKKVKSAIFKIFERKAESTIKFHLKYLVRFCNVYFIQFYHFTLQAQLTTPQRITFERLLRRCEQKHRKSFHGFLQKGEGRFHTEEMGLFIAGEPARREPAP